MSTPEKPSETDRPPADQTPSPDPEKRSWKARFSLGTLFTLFAIFSALVVGSNAEGAFHFASQMGSLTGEAVGALDFEERFGLCLLLLMLGFIAIYHNLRGLSLLRKCELPRRHVRTFAGIGWISVVLGFAVVLGSSRNHPGKSGVLAGPLGPKVVGDIPQETTLSNEETAGSKNQDSGGGSPSTLASAGSSESGHMRFASTQDEPSPKVSSAPIASAADCNCSGEEPLSPEGAEEGSESEGGESNSATEVEGPTSGGEAQVGSSRVTANTASSTEVTVSSYSSSATSSASSSFSAGPSTYSYSSGESSSPEEASAPEESSSPCPEEGSSSSEETSYSSSEEEAS